MQPETTIVIATRNIGKTIEIKELLKNSPINIKNLDDFGPIPHIEEDGATFEENAYKKASLTARYLGFPSLADDSGLVVEALDGEPGVLSARYAGENATDEERCRKLLQALDGHQNRQARFECVISIAVPTGPALTYEASCQGEIAPNPLGDNGFGYDPVFFYPPLGKTFAQLSTIEKGEISHRGKALRELSGEFEKVMIWLKNHMPQPDPFGCMEGHK
jgi:XTP/dITP diphosphohydrolase